MPEKSPLPDAWSERPAWCSQGTLPQLGDGTGRTRRSVSLPSEGAGTRRRKRPHGAGHRNAPGGLQTLTVEENGGRGNGVGGRGEDDTVRDRKTHLRGR